MVENGGVHVRRPHVGYILQVTYLVIVWVRYYSFPQTFPPVCMHELCGMIFASTEEKLNVRHTWEKGETI